MKRKLNYTYLSVLLLAPIVVLILPIDYFDTGRSMCLSVLLFDKTCYGCGMTRAIQHLIHFDINGAASFNKLSFVTLPLLIFVWGQEVVRTYKRIKKTA